MPDSAPRTATAAVDSHQHRDRPQVRSLDPLEDLVENAALAIHRVDAHGVVIWANRAELELLGYTRDEYVGRSIAEFHVDAALAADLLARLKRFETVEGFEVQLRAKDGTIRHAEVTSNVARDADGRFVATRCFTFDVTARKEAESALRRRDLELRLLADSTPALLSYIGCDGTYQIANHAYERLFARPRREIEGRHLRDLLGEAGWGSVRPQLERALAGETVSFEVATPVGDESRWLEATYAPHRGEDGRVEGVVALLVDVSERKEHEAARQLAEHRLARQLERAEQLVALTGALSRAATHREVLAVMMEQGTVMLRAKHGAIWLRDGDSPSLELAHSAGYPEDVRERLLSLPLGGAKLPVTDAFESGLPRWIFGREELFARYPAVRSLVPTPSWSCAAALPLAADGRSFGALAFTFDAPSELDTSEQRFLEVVAVHCAQALDRARLFERERASSRRNEILARASRALSGATLDIRAVLEEITREVATSLGDCAVLFLVDEAGERLHHGVVQHAEPAAAAQLRELLASTPLQAGVGVTGRALREGAAQRVSGEALAQRIGETAPQPYRDWLARYPVAAALAVPLRSRGRTIGVLTLVRHLGEGEVASARAFTADDQQLVEDLCDRAALALETARAYDEANQARESREELMAIVSHDLRNPLAAILTSAVLLHRLGPEARPDRVERQAAVIHRSAQRMSRLLGDLLDFSSIQANHLQVAPVPIRVSELLEELRELEPLALEKGKILELSPPSPDPWVACEGERIHQVLSNLVGNAIKYALPGRIHVSAVADGPRVRFVVVDEGPGIAPEQLGRIFDRFWQLQSGHGAVRQGVGLGLYIARGIVAAHGGALEVENAPGQGARFSFDLPGASPP